MLNVNFLNIKHFYTTFYTFSFHFIIFISLFFTQYFVSDFVFLLLIKKLLYDINAKQIIYIYADYTRFIYVSDDQILILNILFMHI